MSYIIENSMGIVRASFTIRWSPRADKFSWLMHSTMSPPVSSYPRFIIIYRIDALPQHACQNCDSPGFRTGQTMSVPSKRARCRSLAACTRFCIDEDVSPRRSLLSFS
jgi:hypothetical protein